MNVNDIDLDALEMRASNTVAFSGMTHETYVHAVWTLEADTASASFDSKSDCEFYREARGTILLLIERLRVAEGRSR